MNELIVEKLGVIGTVRFIGYGSCHFSGEGQRPGVTVIVENRDGGKMEGYIDYEDLPRVVEYLQKFIQK